MSMSSDTPEQFRYKPLDKEQVVALRALEKGEASPAQQRLALSVIVKNFSRTHDVLYLPGSFDGSAFLTGRGFVGTLILKYLNIPLGQLNKENPSNDR